MCRAVEPVESCRLTSISASLSSALNDFIIVVFSGNVQGGFVGVAGAEVNIDTAIIDQHLRNGWVALFGRHVQRCLSRRCSED